MGDSENTKKIGFFKNVSIEFKKVVWPRKDVFVKQAVAVTVISIVLGVVIAVLDFFIQYGVKFITQ